MKKFWTILFVGALTLQVGGFYLLDRFLGGGAVTTSTSIVSSVLPTSTAVAAQDEQKPDVQPPDESEGVRVYDIDPSGKMIVLVDRRDQVVVKDGKGAVQALYQLENVHDLHWMDEGSTVLYFRTKYGMTEFGVVKVNQEKVLPLYDLPSRDVQIEQVFVSPYSQSINFLYKQDDQLFVGYYEAIFGFRNRQLRNVTPKTTSFDAKKETLSIIEEDGTEWEFTSGRLKQVKGKQSSSSQKTGSTQEPRVPTE